MPHIHRGGALDLSLSLRSAVLRSSMNPKLQMPSHTHTRTPLTRPAAPRPWSPPSKPLPRTCSAATAGGRGPCSPRTWSTRCV